MEGDISDPLVSSIQGLNAADHDADKAAASIRLANEGVKTALLVTRLAMGDPTAWVELALRYLNVSFAWSQSRSSFESRQDIPTDLVFNELTLDNERTFVQGFIKAKNLAIRTGTFKTAPLVNESKLRHSQHSGSWTPGTTSVSVSSSSSSRDETIHVPSQITADHLILECDDGVISGTQIRARIVDALVKNTLTIESVLNVLNEKRNGIDISTNWDIRLEDHHHVREKIDEMASLIGVEEFYLKVGALLLTRSALIGSPDGVEVIDAAERRHEIIQERDEKSGFVINAPMGTSMELIKNTIELQQQITALKQQVFEDAQEMGDSPDEALEAAAQIDDIVKILQTADEKIAAAEAKARAAHKAIQDQIHDVPPEKTPTVQKKGKAPQKSDASKRESDLLNSNIYGRAQHEWINDALRADKQKIVADASSNIKSGFWRRTTQDFAEDVFNQLTVGYEFLVEQSQETIGSDGYQGVAKSWNDDRRASVAAGMGVCDARYQDGLNQGNLSKLEKIDLAVERGFCYSAASMPDMVTLPTNYGDVAGVVVATSGIGGIIRGAVTSSLKNMGLLYGSAMTNSAKAEALAIACAEKQAIKAFQKVEGSTSQFWTKFVVILLH